MIVPLLIVIIVFLCEISYNIKALNNNVIEIIKLFNKKTQKEKK